MGGYQALWCEGQRLDDRRGRVRTHAISGGIRRSRVGRHRLEIRTLAPLNPLGQVPTLVMPDGAVMTESAAIVLHLAEHRAGRRELAPPPRSSATRRVPALAGVSGFGGVFDVHLRRCAEALGRWRRSSGKVLRESHRRPSRNAVAISRKTSRQPVVSRRYVVCARPLHLADEFWRPGRDWFAEHCPKLHAIGAAMGDDPHCKAVAKRNGF